MKKMLFVYNPMSGKGLIRNSLSTIIEILSANDYEVTVHPTRAALDGEKIVEDNANRYDIIVCSGGDGTLDEIVTGLMRSGENRPVGYIPAGSTNDFAASVGIPRQMDEAARTITSGEIFQCDLGRFNDSYFVYVAAFGIFTDVSYQTPQELKNTLGHVAYLIEGMKRMGTWKSHHLKIDCEEFQDEGEYVFGMITNSNFVGGIRGITGRNVDLNDGVFEVMLVRTPQNLLDWQEIIAAVLTHDTTSSRVLMFQTRHMTIESEEPLAWTRDGENGGEHHRIEVENLPGRLQIHVGKIEESQ